jgi:hypothetical protein
MKILTFFFLLFFCECCFAQTKHDVVVAINQPEKCTVTALDQQDFSIQIYPNPADKYLIIESDKKINEVQIIDLTGRIVDQTQQQGNQIQLDLSNYKKGLYQCFIKNDNRIKHFKFIVQ